MKGKLIYYGIIVMGIGAIAYMYRLSDLGNQETDKKIIDDLLDEGNLKVK